MNVSIRWKDCDKSDAVAAHLQNKVDGFSTFKFVMPNAKAEIVYYPKQQSFTIRINVQVVKKGTLRAEAKANDILTAINECADKITEQLRKIKDRYDD